MTRGDISNIKPVIWKASYGRSGEGKMGRAEQEAVSWD